MELKTFGLRANKVEAYHNEDINPNLEAPWSTSAKQATGWKKIWHTMNKCIPSFDARVIDQEGSYKCCTKSAPTYDASSRDSWLQLWQFKVRVAVQILCRDALAIIGLYHPLIQEWGRRFFHISIEPQRVPHAVDITVLSQTTVHIPKDIINFIVWIINWRKNNQTTFKWKELGSIWHNKNERKMNGVVWNNILFMRMKKCTPKRIQLHNFAPTRRG